MGIETESEQTYEPILNVGDENIKESERSEQFLIEASGPGDEGISLQDDASMARCNRRGFIQLSVALTEIQSDEVDAEFAL
jgi:hypothetical protein